MFLNTLLSADLCFLLSFIIPVIKSTMHKNIKADAAINTVLFPYLEAMYHSINGPITQETFANVYTRPSFLESTFFDDLSFIISPKVVILMAYIILITIAINKNK